MVNDNDNIDPRDASQPTTSLPMIDEQANLEEGRAARRELALRTAHEVIAQPGLLDGKRLSRLGPDGVAVLVAELHRSLPVPDQPKPGSPSQGSPRVEVDPRRSGASRSAVRPAAARPGPKAGAKRAGMAVSPKVRTTPLDGVAAWWRVPATPPFEQTAYRRGLILGAFLILALVPFAFASGF